MSTDERYVSALCDDFAAFLEEAAREDPHPNPLTFPNAEWRIFAAGNLQIVYRRPETAAALEKLEGKIYRRRDWTKKWSGDYIERAFSNALTRIGDGAPEQVHEAIAAMARDLDEEPKARSVVFAISGLALSQGEVRLGSIRLFKMADEREQFRESFYRIIATVTNPEDQKEHFRRQTDEFLDSYGGLAAAEVPAVGDVEGAQNSAILTSEPILDFLQMIAAIEEPSAKKIRIVGGAGLIAQQPPRFVISNDRKEANWNQKFPRNYQMDLTEARIKKIVGLGFQAVVDALSKSEESRLEFEEMLLNAVHWIADAEKQERLENRVTSYTTAMELFFTAEDGPIVRDLSESVAYLLGKDLKTRREIKALVARLYKERSKVSHRGQRSALEKDVRELKSLAINVVALMSRMAKRFETKADVQSFFSDLRLSARFDPMARRVRKRRKANSSN